MSVPAPPSPPSSHPSPAQPGPPVASGRRPGLRRGGALPAPVAHGAVAGATAVAASLGFALLTAVVGWLSAGLESAEWAGVLVVGAGGWLLAHAVPLPLPGGPTLTLAPLGLTAVAALAAWTTGRHAAATLAAGGRDTRGGTGGRGSREAREASRARTAWAAAAGFVGAYAAAALAMAVLVSAGTGGVSALRALLGGAVLAAATGGVALLQPAGVDALPPAVRRVPPGTLRGALPAAGAALATLAVAGSLLVAAALVAGSERVRELTDALGVGAGEGLALVLAQLALLPVLVVWAVAWLAGPGFAVGSGTAVTLVGVDLAGLPALPLLGALPPSGALPSQVRAAVLVPVLAGVVAAVVLLRRRAAAPPSHPAPPGALLVAVAATAVLAGVGAAVAAGLASGAVGPGRMADVGPSALAVGLAVAVEVAVGALAALGAARGARSLLPQRAGRPGGR